MLSKMLVDKTHESRENGSRRIKPCCGNKGIEINVRNAKLKQQAEVRGYFPIYKSFLALHALEFSRKFLRSQGR
ncbi:Hypothetical predicted protein [Olea europaea subsp. europaea]|uniref:Uncharacterized protein n=1 Tax=Olea europaea subsp. europaea TaxID=158383 RepID=A0A8S0SC31_OLEEU|nr:Hypothetical predicted protein [Olea europaea subsp. europaea]